MSCGTAALTTHSLQDGEHRHHAAADPPRCAGTVPRPPGAPPGIDGPGEVWRVGSRVGLVLTAHTDLRENTMSAVDKIKNKAEELLGQGKEAAGNATDNDRLKAEGQGDQASANTKQAGEKVKDVFK